MFSFKNMHYKSVANHKYSDNRHYGMGQRWSLLLLKSFSNTCKTIYFFWAQSSLTLVAFVFREIQFLLNSWESEKHSNRLISRLLFVFQWFLHLCVFLLIHCHPGRPLTSHNRAHITLNSAHINRGKLDSPSSGLARADKASLWDRVKGQGRERRRYQERCYQRTHW